MAKNDNINKKAMTANEVYSLCRIYQTRQAIGREMTEAELDELNRGIERELNIHETQTIAKWNQSQRLQSKQNDK